MENKSFAIEGMTCASCAQTVEKAAKKVRGVTQPCRYSSCDGSLVYFWRTIDESNVCGSRHEFQLRIGLAQCFTVKTIQTSSCLENT
ncbi:MAG: cation transporter [Methanobrevibacter sp.]|nr:cation transporter [Methanobrevibacter sp.]